jgi:hypothetical protein
MAENQFRVVVGPLAFMLREGELGPRASGRLSVVLHYCSGKVTGYQSSRTFKLRSQPDKKIQRQIKNAAETVAFCERTDSQT